MRRYPKVDPSDPAALLAWLTAARTLAADLQGLTIDATAAKAHRCNSRTYLRSHTRRHFQALGALLAALDPTPPPPAPDAPATP